MEEYRAWLQFQDVANLVILRGRSALGTSRGLALDFALCPLQKRALARSYGIPRSMLQRHIGVSRGTVGRRRSEQAKVADKVVDELIHGKDVILEFDATTLSTAAPDDKQLLGIILHYWGKRGPAFTCLSIVTEVAGDGATLARVVLRELRQKLTKGARIIGIVTDHASANGTARRWLSHLLAPADRPAPGDVPRPAGAGPIGDESEEPAPQSLGISSAEIPRVACLCHMLHNQIKRCVESSLFGGLRKALN